MAKPKITLPEVKKLLELGCYRESKDLHSRVYHEFPDRDDNLICAAVVNEDAIIIQNIMIRSQGR